MKELIKESESLYNRINGVFSDLVLTRATDDAFTKVKIMLRMEKLMGEMIPLLAHIIERKDNIVDLGDVWHGIDVEPQKGYWFVGQMGDYAYDTFIAEIEGKSMKNWIEGCNIKRWAYIKDLLPKGGG